MSRESFYSSIRFFLITALFMLVFGGMGMGLGKVISSHNQQSCQAFIDQSGLIGGHSPDGCIVHWDDEWVKIEDLTK